MLRVIKLFVLFLFLYSSHSGANDNKAHTDGSLHPITLQLLWKHQFEFAGFYAAKAQGYYKEYGLDVNLRELHTNENPANEVIEGRAQYGINDSTLIIERGKGKPVVLLSNIFQHSPLILLAKSESGITSPAHMVGKKIMLGSNVLSNASILAMFQKESVSINDTQIIPQSFNVDDLIKNNVDVMSAYATNQPGTLKNKNIPINIISPINYGIDFYGNNIFTSENEIKNHPQRAQKFVTASLKGWQYALENPDEIINLILADYSQKKSREDLEFEANSLPQFILPNFIPLGTIDESRIQRIINIYQELGVLDSSFSLDGFLSKHYLHDKNKLSLFSKSELAWIKDKKEITLGVDPNWLPFEFIDENRQYSGMAADFISIIANKSGLKINVQKNSTWTDVIDSAKNKTLDVLPAVMKSDSRDKFLDFTSPHIVYPMVITTTKESKFISQLNDLKGEKVVVVKGYITEEIIRQNHPSLNVITANNIDEALTLVSNGEATAFVDNLATITTSISKGGFSNLRISGTTKYNFQLSLAVPKGQKVLLNILQKSLDNISDEEKNRIKNKWISLQYTKTIDYSLVYMIALSSVIIILIIFIWNRRLSLEVRSRKIAELKAQESEKRFRMLFEDNKAIELIINPATGDIIKANNAAIAFYGYSEKQLSSIKINEINTLTEDQIEAEMFDAKAQQRSHFYFKHQLANGEVRDVEVHSGPIQWEEQQLLYSIIHDVTNEKRLQDELSEKAVELEYYASHDSLTGLLNRREFESRLHKAINLCVENKSCKKSVLALDLDNFKVINDTAGHAIGDKVLRNISRLMHSKVRDRDTFARLGGDEFGVILDNCSLVDAEGIAQTIIDAVKNFQYTWNKSTFHLGVSIGISKIDCSSPDRDDTLNQADAACYEAKSKGRNRYQIYSAENSALTRKSGERWWTNEILSAIEENRFCLYHQEIISLSPEIKQEGKQFEILIRMYDKSNKLVFPDNFIPPAEQFNLMPLIDKWVINQTFLWLHKHPNDLKRLHKCSINLSGQSIASKDFYTFVKNKIMQHKIPAKKICWEITETAAIANFERAQNFINQMRELGCSFSLDDFGSGLSSFGYLKHLEVDYIKIDGSFIKEILSDPKDQLIVESIINISCGLNTKTIAEFVENDAIKQKLIEIGADYAQGYGIHKPSPL